jgi:multicomponent Na+:H+ antiporter subunit E
MMRYTLLFILSFLLWLVLTLNLTFFNLIAGMIAALICTLFFGKKYVSHAQKILQPERYFWLLLYVLIFTWECIKANLDVAYRVLHPALPIKPGIVKVHLRIKSDMARTMLATSITMTPGTIAIDIVHDDLYVHWIYVSSFDPADYTEKIVGRFEKYIEKIFD